MTITASTLKAYHLVTVCFVFGVLICQLQLVESITFTDIGFKMCLIKCIQYGCPGIKYNIENQMCQLLDPEMIMEETGQLFGPMDLSDVGTGDCGFKTCQGMRCPKTCAGQISCAKGGRDQAQPQNTGNSTLIDACRNGDLLQVKHILSQGTAHINTRETYGRTPAMIAVKGGQREILELLVKEGSDLSQLDDDQNNILHLASEEGHLEIVKYICSLKIIDIENRDFHGRTPIMLAALFGQTGVFVFLAEMGADLSLLDNGAENMFHLSSQGGGEEIVKYIIKHTLLDINSKVGGMTAVSLAAAFENRAAFETLVEVGADLLAVDTAGNSVLHWSCQGGDMDIVKYILKQNIVDINSRGADGRSPALIAAVYGHSTLFEYLVKNGADLSVEDDDGDNILHSSCEGGDMDIVKYVFKQNIVDINTRTVAGQTPVSIAAVNGHSAVLEYLVKGGANLSAVNEDGENILHLACEGGDMNTVKYVLNLNVVDINSKGIDGYTPVMLATGLEDRDVFDLLIERGADVSVETYDSDNVFHMDMVTFCKMCCHTAWEI